LTSASALTGSHEDGTQYIDALKVRGHLVQIRQDFAVDGALSSVHHANHHPVAASEMQCTAHPGRRKTFCDRFADHQFTLAGIEPAPGDDLHLRTQFFPDRRHAAKCDIISVRRIHADQIDDCHHLQRRQRFILSVARDAGQILEGLIIGALHVAHEFRVRPLPENQNIERVAGRVQRSLQAIHQRKHGQ